MHKKHIFILSAPLLVLLYLYTIPAALSFAFPGRTNAEKHFEALIRDTIRAIEVAESCYFERIVTENGTQKSPGRPRLHRNSTHHFRAGLSRQKQIRWALEYRKGQAVALHIYTWQKDRLREKQTYCIENTTNTANPELTKQRHLLHKTSLYTNTGAELHVTELYVTELHEQEQWRPLREEHIYPEAQYTITPNKIFWEARTHQLALHSNRKRKSLVEAPDDLIPVLTGESIQYIEYIQGSQPGPTFLFLHPNEYTAYRGLREWVRENGGRAYLFTGPGKPAIRQRERHFPVRLGSRSYFFDANRIFSRGFFRRHFYLVGRLYGYEDNDLDYFPEVGDRLFRELAKLTRIFTAVFTVRRQPAFIIHDNDGDMGWSVRILNGYYGKTARKARRKQREPGSDFFYTTTDSLYKRLCRSGFNVILQNNDTVKNDGSASVYFAALGHPYVSLEIARDRAGSTRQKARLKEMLNALNTLNTKSP